MENKKQKQILQKLGISQLNEMQEEARLAIPSDNDVVLLSPTGSGKTLAFLLPIINRIDTNNSNTQVLILAPSRELAIQIEQVTREMGTGFKTNVVYGGRPFSKDRIDLKHTPIILIGTPGRIADHLRRGTVNVKGIKTLILDEFDKSLEIGFEKEMKEIVASLPSIDKKILTSATQESDIPAFVGLHKPITINYLDQKVESNLELKTVLTPKKDKLEALVSLIKHIGNQPGIIFCNFKDSIQRISNYLNEFDIPHGTFYGGMEQKDRERALIKFRNGTHQILLATDLAARGIDIKELNFIIHYHLPLKAEEFTHRNGRTARMNADGTAYVLQWEREELPDFIQKANPDNYHIEEMYEALDGHSQKWKTIFVSGGRKDKISKGDIAGLFGKQGNLEKGDLGIIELKPDCAFVAVKANKAHEVILRTDNTRLKKKKVRVKLI
ncbi:DEAD/DEAH box helicase [Pseudofulvibacter geojedonensis]|uniref:DEAD/DEAH box helicase n=1 Tax=Pseudofulvibacter geojedonensis TaxID=1123758 RepID=A0ABW3HYT7_9FLAO